VVSRAVLLGVPTPCFSTALAFYDGYRSEMLPANLIQVIFFYLCFVFDLPVLIQKSS
jgi:6-phosphogluconate dehydrogenase